MATNRDNPHGLIPRKHISGGEIRAESVKISASNSAIGIGDQLVQVNDGTMNRASAGDVIAAVAAQAVAANTGGSALAYLDPDIIYSAQTDNGTGTATAQTAVNLNIDIVTGAPVNGRSILELDESSANTTATLPWKILGLYPASNNSFGEFNELLVVANNHKMKAGTGTLGV